MKLAYELLVNCNTFWLAFMTSYLGTIHISSFRNLLYGIHRVNSFDTLTPICMYRTVGLVCVRRYLENTRMRVQTVPCSTQAHAYAIRMHMHINIYIWCRCMHAFVYPLIHAHIQIHIHSYTRIHALIIYRNDPIECIHDIHLRG